MDNNFLKIKNLLQFVVENKHSDLYQAKYSQAGFNYLTDFNSISDIAKIPFMAKKELSEAPLDKILFVPEEEIGHVCRTSGTTENPLLTFRSEKDKPNGSEIIKGPDFGRMLILANPFQASKLYARNRLQSKHIVAVGDIHKMSESCQLGAKLQIKTVRTTATLAIILKDYLQKYPAFQKSLKFFIINGELISPAKKKIIKELYPGVEIFINYGISETGPSAFQCVHLAKKEDSIFFHPRFSDYHFEIIKPDGQPVIGLEEKGEIVLTDLWNRATPIIRYKTGDMASFHENNCPCGATGPLIQIWGRINRDFVRVGGFEIRKDMLEKPLLNLRQYIKEDFEAHIYENFIDTKPKIKITLNLALKENVKESADLKKLVTSEFLKNLQLSPRFNLKTAVEAGLFDPIEINFVEYDQKPKTKGELILH